MIDIHGSAEPIPMNSKSFERRSQPGKTKQGDEKLHHLLNWKENPPTWKVPRGPNVCYSFYFYETSF